MADLIAQNLAPIMFVAMVFLLLTGYPVAFVLAATGLTFFVVAVELAPFAPTTIKLSWSLLQALPDRVFGTMATEVLLAVPFFTFMGLILERSGMAEDLLDTIGQLFGTVRGGLAYAVVFVGTLLAATTGVVAASVISMGLISLPIMLRYGYDRRLASGIIAASGSLAQIIPPSLILIVMADQLGVSVGDLYEGAFLPGVLLAGLYATYVFLASIVSPKAAPGLPPEAVGFREPNGSRGIWQLGVLVLYSVAVADWIMLQTDTKAGSDFVILTISISALIAVIGAAANRLFAPRVRLPGSLLASFVLIGGSALLLRSNDVALGLLVATVAAGVSYVSVTALCERFTGVRLISTMAERVTFVMVPPLLLIFLVLGTIFIGLATPTEGGAMGAVGSVVLAAAKRYMDKDASRFNFKLVRDATESIARLSAFVMFILIGARVFSLTFYGVNGHVWVEHLLTSLPSGQTGFLVFTAFFVFILAFFLDFFEIAFIIFPLLVPAATKLDIDLVWFGVMLGVLMQTSFLHPPFGAALFFLRAVAPREPYRDRVSGEMVQPVTTGQIYWGSIPFIVIQLLMVALVVVFPQMVMHYKSGRTTVAPSAVDKQLDQVEIPEFDPMEQPAPK